MTYEQVREEVARLLWMDGDTDDSGWEHTAMKPRLRDMADTILSLKYPNGNPMLYVGAEDQTIPIHRQMRTAPDNMGVPSDKVDFVERIQLAMQDDGFRRIEKRMPN